MELQKFAKLMRQRRPESKCSMHYDKLIIDHEIYMFNDITGQVEEVSQKPKSFIRNQKFFNTRAYQ